MRSAALTRLVPLLAVGALLTAAAVAASLATPQVRDTPLPQFSRPEPSGPTLDPFNAVGAPPPASADASPSIELPSWLGTVLLVGIAAFLLVVAGVLIFLLVRGWRPVRRVELPPEEPVTATEEEQLAAVIAAVDAGLADLDDGDPRAAVIACWVRLEEAAAAAGTPRAPGDTPSELVLRLLAEHHVSADVLYPLAEVYRLARYATHTVDTRMRDQARAALGQLRAELTRPAEAGAGAGVTR